MKKYILLVVLSSACANLFAQGGEFWGVTRDGGDNFAGSIYKIDEDGTNQTTVYSFDYEVNGSDPDELTMVELNGLLYGTTDGGGINDDGTLFSYDPMTGTVNTLHFFLDTVSGENPFGPLFTENGKIYGLTADDGPTGDNGTIFEYDPVLDTLKTVVEFDSNQFDGFTTRFQIGSDGHFYGVSSQGGFTGDGVIFKADRNTGIVTLLYEFDNAVNQDGFRPDGSLVELSPGVFYGITRTGGINNDGVIFRFDVNTNTYTKMIDLLQATTGESPTGGLILGSNQLIYGVCRRGGTNEGTIFEFDPVMQTITVLHNLSEDDGEFSESALTEISPGIFYGMAERGGTNNDGTLFEYNLNTSTFTKKIDFERDTIGENPNGNLFLASNGNLYGSLQDGPLGEGTIFEYLPGATDVQVVVDFEKALSGAQPQEQLAVGPNGKIYGTTFQKGSNNQGTLFEFDPVTEVFTLLHDFTTDAQGEQLEGSLVIIGDMVYGVASEGGSVNGSVENGTLFSYNLTTNTFNVEYTFDNSTGRNPGNGLILSSQGTLIGNTFNGGLNGGGVLYEYDVNTGTYSSLFNFGVSTTGSGVDDPLLEYQPGVFYGTVDFTSSGDGAVFKYDRNTNTFTTIHVFLGGINDGDSPESSLLLAADGLLYGTTRRGGTDDEGVLYSIDPSTDTYSVVASFLAAPSLNAPGGSLVQAPNGEIFGISELAGTKFRGGLFKFDPVNTQLENISINQIVFNNIQGGLISVPDIYLPSIICQDLNLSLDGMGIGTYTAASLDGGSTDNSSALFLGLTATEIALTTTNNSPSDEYFADGNIYFYEEGTFILDAPATVSFTDPALEDDSANSILIIYDSKPSANRGLLDDRFGLVGYISYSGSATIGNNSLSLAANRTYYIQRASLSPLGIGTFDLESDIAIITDLAERGVGCAEAGTTIPEIVYAYDRAGNLTSCTANVTVLEDEDPVLSADLIPVPGTIIPCGKADFEVSAVATDNCGDPTILNVIEVPQLSNPTVLYKVRSTNALKFRLDQNAVKVLGPDPVAFWNQVQADGGIAVEDGQIITYREVNSNSNPIVYNFNGANELSLVKNDHMTLVSTAT
ncbi:MAG: choice-of-anchor tandem repeat GloVer-containing protein, partial [Bacteroidota bacterium]